MYRRITLHSNMCQHYSIMRKHRGSLFELTTTLSALIVLAALTLLAPDPRALTEPTHLLSIGPTFR